MKLKLFHKIFFSFFCVSLVPMAVGGWYFVQILADYQQQTIVELSRSRVSLASQKLVDKISSIEQSIYLTSRKIQQPVGSFDLLADCALQHKDVLKEIVTDQEGRVVTSYMRYGFMAGGSKVALPPIGPAEKRHVAFVNWNLEPQLAVAYPLVSVLTGKRQGMLLAEISLKNLFSMLLCHKDEQRNLYIVSSEGRIVSHDNINYVLEGRDISSMSIIHDLRLGQDFANGEYLDLEGRKVVGVGMRVDDLPLYVVEETPVAVAYGLSRALSRDLLKVCCFVAFFILVAALLLARSITRPIVQLEKATARVVSGELDSKVELSHRIHDEIDIFALRFNEMITALKEDRARRQEAEASLAAERERLMVTLRSIGDGVISTDLNGRITLMNRAAEEMTGWSMDEALGRPVNQVFQLVDLESGEPYDDPLAEVFSQGHHVRLDDNVALIARDGHKRQVADSGTPIRDRESNIVGVVLFFQDITVRKRMETELQQAEKIRSVGLLAGGIAHDFNNQLTGILGNIGLAKMTIAPESKAYSYLDAAENAAIRSSGLTQQLLTFAKGGAPVKQLASIADLLRETSKFILRGSAVDCRLEIGSDIWPLDFDEGQLNQVMNNLLINAMQSMPDGGIITIKVENYRLDSADEVPLTPGRYVRIMISDQGIGMTQSHLRRIFEPYFTTKKEGRGLGLASSYSIINNHDGFISVESEPDQGTTFTVYLPASERKVREQEEKEEAEVMVSGDRILVMDDEEMVRDVAGGFLRHLGFLPSFAADGREAVALYQQAVDAGEPFAAVFMDLTIPGGMGGRECVQEILKINPQARVIVASGYSTDPIMADFRQYGFSGGIVKPFSLADFSAVLQKVL